jgi:hypothetical protein
LQGVFEIVDGTPGTGSGFWIQTTPGVAGVVPATPNISNRDILGVTNNGDDLGIVSFNVPLKTAQQFYYNLTDVGPIDLLTTLEYSQINNQPLDVFIATYGGIDGITYLSTRTLVFVNDANDTNVYQIVINTVGGIDYINLVIISTVAANEKFTISYGVTYSNTSWYAIAAGYFQQIPLLSAALDTLYYQDGTDPEIFGRILLLDPVESSTTFIDQILGQPNNTSPTGVAFTNGLKVRFTGDVVPASYGSGTTSVVCISTTAGSNYFTCETTAGLYEGEQIIFPVTGNGVIEGQIYYIKSIAANGIQFSISTVADGATVMLTTDEYQNTATAISNNEYY